MATQYRLSPRPLGQPALAPAGAPPCGRLRRLILFSLLWLGACGGSRAGPVPVAVEPGQVSRGEDEFGPFFTYAPAGLPEEPEFLVIVHGTPIKNQTEDWNAEYYIRSWLDFADEHDFVLIAPVFNQEDFSSRLGDHARSGYRGLFGREIAADEWVLRLVRGHQQALGAADDPFYLYGHSAGGQFAARFLVTHPEEIKRAVITAAATYPQPTIDFEWPFGMGELHTWIEWNPGTVTQVDFVPDRQKWLDATQIPLAVIVGLDDNAELPADLVPGQNGRDRITIANNWVDAMESFAVEQGLDSRYEISIIPGIGHSMSGLLQFSQQALLIDTPELLN
jgi:hypothetical protein